MQIEINENKEGMRLFMAKGKVKEISEMSIQEIIDEVGLNITNSHEVEEYILNSKVPNDVIMGIFKRIDAINRNTKKKNLTKNGSEYLRLEEQNPLLELLKKYEDEVDKEKMVLVTLYNTQSIIEEEEENPNSKEKEYIEIWRKYASRAVELIGNKHIVIADLDFKEGTPRLHVIDSERVIACIKEGRKLSSLKDAPSVSQQRRFDKILEEIPLKDMIGLLFYQDMQDVICTYPECGGKLITLIIYEAVEEYKKDHPESTANYKDHDEVLKIVSETPKYNDIVFNALRNNCRYINMEKLLLVLAHNMIITLESNEDISFEEMESVYLHEVFKSMTKYIGKKTQVELKYNDQVIIYGIRELEEDAERFTDSRYIKRKEIEETKKQLLSKKLSLPNADKDVLQCIGFTKEEIKELSTSDENLIFLIDAETVNVGNMSEYINRESYSEALFKAMVENQLFEYEDAVELLENGKIEANYIINLGKAEWISNLNEEAKNEIRELSIKITNKEQKTNSDDMRKFNLYALIYKQININGKSDDEIRIASNALIEGLEENISEEILNELYQYGIIDLETAADWGMDIEPMILNNSLKPVDFRNLYLKGIITKERIKHILKGNTLSYEEKIDLIYSTFNGEDEEEIKLVDELLEELGIQKESSFERTGGKRKKGVGKHVNKYVVDAHTRWRIISAGDKDYSRNFLPKEKTILDGHRVFLLINRNEVVIEKMHQKTRESKKDAYGYATYLMPSDVFFERIDEIIEDGQINRTALRRMAEDGQAIKLNHDRVWGIALKDHFGIDERQPELNAEIDSAIKRYRECKERI